MPQRFAQFSARARVVDLLGRQQISDVPTALGELFKNAIDAAAQSVRLDYWPEYGCFSAADDGLGMRQQEDLLQRWMVLATDSKHGPPSTAWTLHATKEQELGLRTYKSFGEKGIGRLAMALLGTGTLVWTRWGEGHDIQRTLLLVPWTVFKHAVMTLDQIKLPMLSLDREATSEDALVLVDQLEEWYEEELLKEISIPLELQKDLTADFAAFRRALKAPLSFPSTAGTSFTVLNTSDILNSHFDGWLVKTDLFEDTGSKDSEGRESYLAFSNRFLPGRSRLAISLFESGREYSLAEENFWEPADFDHVDHCIEAEIDESGFAKVHIRMHQDSILHESQLRMLPKRCHSPGPLHFKIGYVEGKIENSKLPSETWTTLSKRVDKFGGFFVYMNDIRVQPYGRANQDFLEFEKHRSLNAGRYFFSHRRMFGGLFLSQEQNAALVEKAGREGFQQTAAYRGMVFWLRSLFVELADAYFGRNAERTDKAERAEERRRRQREEREAEAKKEFETELNRSRQRLDVVVRKFREQHAQFTLYLRTVGEKATTRQLAECRRYVDDLRRSYEHLWDGFILAAPSFYSPAPRQAEVIDSYFHEKQVHDDATRALLTSASLIVEKLSAAIETPEAREATETELLKAHYQRLEFLMQQASTPALAAVERLRRSIEQSGKAIITEITALVQDSTAPQAENEEAGAIREDRMARQQRLAQEQAVLYFDTITRWLNTIASGDTSILDIHDLREEIRHSRERESRLLELAQLGLVIESVDHDYHAMLGNIGKAISAVKERIPQNDMAVLDRLVAGVEHLDERLQFWDPLVRRGSSTTSRLTGEEVRTFILGVMDQHNRQHVLMEFTPKFVACEINNVKRSSFIGAVHNLVMNAGYWSCKDAPEGKVRFSMHEEGFVISDSGPGVTDRDRRHIFEPGFSRRPTGRGLGLYIARSTLQSFGCDIRLLDAPATGALKGANFLITLSSRNRQ